MAKAPAITPGSSSTPAGDESFIREVDEEYRKSQLRSFWSRWGLALVALVVIGIAALGGFLWWQAQQRNAAGQTGEDFASALTKLETGNVSDAAPILARLADGDTGYAALARLTEAANAVQAGNSARAIEIYQGLARNAKLPQPLRDLATIKATRLEFDVLPPAQVIERLKLLSLPGNPWFGVAGEMTAVARLKAGQPQLAGPLLASIARDATLPPSLRGRAQQLAGSLGVEIGPLPAGAR